VEPAIRLGVSEDDPAVGGEGRDVLVGEVVREPGQVRPVDIDREDLVPDAHEVERLLEGDACAVGENDGESDDTRAATSPRRSW
jgi:hypothetical protein